MTISKLILSITITVALLNFTSLDILNLCALWVDPFTFISNCAYSKINKSLLMKNCCSINTSSPMQYELEPSRSK